jgi:hypothetical protein
MLSWLDHSSVLCRSRCTLALLGLALSISVVAAASAQTPPRDAIRLALKEKAASMFKTSSNHCETFAKVAEAAVAGTDDVGDVLEDLKLVLIGEDWLRRKGMRGKYYMDVRTNDSGFKNELKDGSPQVEHAMAAIYLAKILPPGGVGANGSFVEFVEAAKNGEKPNAADMLLYMYGEDIGDRLAKSNLKQFPTALRRTICS